MSVIETEIKATLMVFLIKNVTTFWVIFVFVEYLPLVSCPCWFCITQGVPKYCIIVTRASLAIYLSVSLSYPSDLPTSVPEAISSWFEFLHSHTYTHKICHYVKKKL